MAGLTIRELLSRRLVSRILVVPPAGLVGNWQREMRTLFRIQARVIRGSDSAKGNPFLGSDADFAIVSLDTLRSHGTFARLREAGLAGEGYDFVIFDEAHKLSADRDPADMTVRKTARYKLAEALAGIPPRRSRIRPGLGAALHHAAHGDPAYGQALPLLRALAVARAGCFHDSRRPG